MVFYNCEKEIRDLLNMIRQEPNLITFIYGPINSGKTVLMYHLVDEVLPRQEERYATFYINLRQYFVMSQESFIRVLFNLSEEDIFSRVKEMISKGISFVLNYHGIPIRESLLEKLLKRKEINDVFEFLKNFFIKLKRNNIKPIIIFDELQVIKDIKINEPLIYRVFNFFISLTKELKLCHVFAITSDSTFIERIYNEAMLQDRARYYLVDDFDRETVEKILRNNGFGDEEIDIVWNYFGGKPIHIVEVIQSKKIGRDIKEYCEEKLEERKNFISEIILQEEDDREFFERIISLLKNFENNYLIRYRKVTPEISFLIENNTLFANPRKKFLKPQSHLELIAIKNLLKEFD